MGELDRVERLLVRQRASESIPTGDFDLSHLQAVHRHLFQDISDRAGEIRSVEIGKSGHQFMFPHYIQTGMIDVHRGIVAADYFKGSSSAEYSGNGGRIRGDVNYVHPFREGNGRTQLFYLRELSEKAGHQLDLGLDLRDIEPKAWIESSKRAHRAEYAPMGDLTRAALAGSQGRPS